MKKYDECSEFNLKTSILMWVSCWIRFLFVHLHHKLCFLISRPKMDVSIIIPVYKVEKYITRCIQSIMNQSCKNIQIECIIIDDCTPDASIDIVNGVLSDYKGDVKFIILRRSPMCRFHLTFPNIRGMWMRSAFCVS